MICNFDQLFEEVRKRPRRTLAVPAAEGGSIVEACAEAAREGICDTILLGDGEKLRGLVSKVSAPEGAIRIVECADPAMAVREAIRLVRDGEADMLMKGKTDTPTLLKAVLDGEHGLRTGRTLSHVAVVGVPTYPRLLLLTDGGLNIRPTYDIRLDIIRNAVDLAARLGNTCPNVALLSAMEAVNPKMEETLDYEKIRLLQEATPFVDAVIEGPLALDVPLSAESARIKGIESKIAGCTDILVTPEITSCNAVVKALVYLGHAQVGGLVVGAKAPIVLLSRSDDAATKLRSIALGALWS